MNDDNATANNKSRPAVGAPVEPSVRHLCSQCRFPLDEYTSGLRYFGTHTAHVEWYCVQRMRGEIERLRMALHEISEEWAGAECGDPVHAQEAYAIGLATRMYALAAAALRPNVRANRPSGAAQE